MLAGLRPSYAVTRQFDFSAWQWLLIGVGGIGLAIFFGFIAVATTAYEVHIVYTADVNGTGSSTQFFQKSPFTWLGSMETTCEAAMLTVGAQYITKNQGFSYTIDKISSTKLNATSVLAYQDQTLDNCDVSSISINLARNDDARQTGNYWTWGATTASATTICQITTNQTFNVSLRVDLPTTLNRAQISKDFLTQDRDNGNQAMYYGMKLLVAWYAQLSLSMAWSAPNNSDSWAAGQITLTRNLSVSDFTDPTYLNITYGQETQQGRLFWIDLPASFLDWSSKGLPNTNITINTFAKTFYALLLSDFGVSDALTPARVDFLQQTVDTVSQKASENCTTLSICDAGTIANVTAGPPAVPMPPTQLVSQYLCSVPQERAKISIVYWVVLAELVFLQGCWALFSMVASAWQVKRNPAANYCDACAKNETSYRAVDAGEAYNLQTIPAKRPLVSQHDED